MFWPDIKKYCVEMCLFHHKQMLFTTILLLIRRMIQKATKTGLELIKIFNLN